MAAVGVAVGPLVGGLVLEFWSWHAAFLVNVPIMAVAILAGLRFLPESRSEQPGRIDWQGFVLSVGASCAVVYAIKQFGKEGADLPAAVGLMLGCGLGAAFARRCLSQSQPMLAVRLLAGRVFRSGVTVALVSSMAQTGLLLVGAQWIQLVAGFSPLEAGVALLPLAIGGLAGPFVVPDLAIRIGVRHLMVSGLSLMGLGMLLLAVPPRPMTYPGVALAFLIVGLGSAALALTSAVIMGAAPTRDAGSAAAMTEMAYEFGSVLGVAVLGSLSGSVYRASLPAHIPDSVLSSLGNATGGPFLAAATSAFTTGFAAVGVAGGAIALAAALLVHRKLPPDLTVGSAGH